MIDTLNNIGWFEVIIVIAILLLLFGSKRISEVGRGLVKVIREFKKAQKDKED